MSIQPTDSAARDLLQRARQHVEYGAMRVYEGVPGGYILRDTAFLLLQEIDAALATPPPAQAAPQAQGEPVKLFKTSVLGVGPYCVEFSDGEIVYTRSEARQKAIGTLYDPPPAQAVPTDEQLIDIAKRYANYTLDEQAIGLYLPMWRKFAAAVLAIASLPPQPKEKP